MSMGSDLGDFPLLGPGSHFTLWICKRERKLGKNVTSTLQGPGDGVTESMTSER